MIECSAVGALETALAVHIGEAGERPEFTLENLASRHIDDFARVLHELAGHSPTSLLFYDARSNYGLWQSSASHTAPLDAKAQVDALRAMLKGRLKLAATGVGSSTIVLAKSQPVGLINLEFHTANEANVSYIFSEATQQSRPPGSATRSIRQTVQDAFRMYPKLTHVYAIVSDQNAKSIAALKRLSFTKVEPALGHWTRRHALITDRAIAEAYTFNGHPVLPEASRSQIYRVDRHILLARPE